MWFLPTFNRPERCAATIKACIETGVSTPGVVFVQGKDDRYRSISLPDGWEMVFHPENIGLSGALNHFFKTHPNLDWYGFLTDDNPPTTTGWDRALIEAAGSKYISHGSDGWQSDVRMAGICCFGGDLLRALGCWAVPGTWHCFNDDLWEALVADFDVRRHVPSAACASPHPMNKKDPVPTDATYQLAYSRMEADQRAWEAWLASPAKVEAWKRIGALHPVEKPKLSVAGSSLYIASPCGDGQFAAPYVISLAQSQRLLHQYGVPYQFAVLEKCSILPHARNRLCQDFLKSDKSHMLFIDADMGWPDYAPLELLAHDKDVIAVPGVTKEIENQKFCVSLSPETLKYDKATGLIRVKQVGTGFMMISRRCLERFAKEYAHLAYKDVRNDDPIMPRWFEHDLTNEDWGEDFTFCRRWREIGGEIWVDPSIPLHHVGQHAFTGKYADALKARDEQREAA